jgi:hypothetical protein
MTICLVVLFGFWTANNPQQVIMHNDIKNHIKFSPHNEAISQFQKYFKLPPPIQTAIAAEYSAEPLNVKVKYITATANTINDNTSTIFIAFDIKNNNQNTILLEGLNYNLYYNNHLIITGSIGSQLISDIFQSRSEFPVLGNASIELKDKQGFDKGSNDTDNELFSNILKANANYTINGTVFYKQISNIQAYGGTQQFETSFP